jgi:hypothetical protein
MMHRMMLTIDPLIIAALDRLAKAGSTTRSRLMRDVIYSYVWSAARDAPWHLRTAPSYPRLIADEDRLRVLDHKLVRVDDDGLPVNP